VQTIQRIADGMVSVYTRRLIKGDIYYARFKITNKSVADGQRYVTESLDTTDKATALDRARQRYAEICLHERENKAIKSGSVKAEIEEFMQEYEAGVEKGLRRHSTHMLIGFRKSIVRYFVEYIGHRPIQDVTADDLRRYETWRHSYWAAQAEAGARVHGNAKEKPALRTLEWEVNAFKQFLRWANERGKYNGDALNFKFVVEKKQARSAFTEEQLNKLDRFMNRKSWLYGVGKHGHDARLTRYRKMLQAYVLFMAGTGLRPGEARNLRWRDIKYDQAAEEQEVVEVFVHATHSKIKKTRTAIGVQMAAFALWGIQAARGESNDHIGDDDYIWCDTDGTVIKDFREGFNNLIKAAGVETDSMGGKLAIYSLRHYYISSRIRHGVDKYDLAKNTGTSVEMIQKFYDHVLTTEKKDELTKFNTRAGERQ
jgi:integrase